MLFIVSSSSASVVVTFTSMQRNGTFFSMQPDLNAERSLSRSLGRIKRFTMMLKKCAISFSQRFYIQKWFTEQCLVFYSWHFSCFSSAGSNEMYEWNICCRQCYLFLGREAIVLYLSRTAVACSDWMPESQPLHISCFQKCHLYPSFSADYADLYGTMPPTQSYFYHVWYSYCCQIKVRKFRRFARCEACDELDTELRNTELRIAIDPHENKQQLKLSRLPHVIMILIEHIE